MRRFYLAAIAAGCMATPVLATPLVLTGNYLKVGISDYGTFGSDGTTSPGILHDPTGTGTFGINDYLTPGNPHDGFELVSDQFNGVNDNNGSSSTFGFTSPTLLTGAAANGYANAASWTGSNANASVTNSYFFNAGDQRVLVKTTITALSDLTGLAFGRSIDPDPDVNTFGSYATNNQRGNSLYGIDDFVGAAGPSTGLTIALINLNGNTFTHSTQISSFCCSNANPFDVLNHTGGDLGLSASGDYGLQLAYNLGSLTAGNSITLTYAYAVGDKIASVGGGVPEPANWAMLIAGFGAVGSVARRRRLSPAATTA